MKIVLPLGTILLVVLAVFAFTRTPKPSIAELNARFTQSLPQLTYTPPEGAAVAFVNGLATTTITEQGTTRTAKAWIDMSYIAYGDLNNDGLVDALVPISEESGRSDNATFLNHALVLNTAGKATVLGQYMFSGPIPSNTSEHIKVIARIKDGVVTINRCVDQNMGMVTMCVTRGAEEVYTFDGEKLIKK
jgi:hypothetical protein